MAKDPQFLLSTEDNPHSPFKEWEAWLMEDIRLGHNTCGLLDRVCRTSDLDDGAELQAMYSIVEHNLSGVHIVVTPMDYAS